MSQQDVYPQQGPSYPPQGSVYPPQGPVYPPQGSVYSPQGSVYPQQGPVYPPQGSVYPPQGSVYSPQRSAYPQQGPVYPPHTNQKIQPNPVAPQQTPRMENFETGEVGDNFEFSDKSIRRGFIKKVYAILTAQLVITFGMVALFFFVDGIKTYTSAHPALVWSAFGISIALLLVLACCPNMRRNAPQNYIFLLLFTICEGFLIGSICAYYDSSDVVKAVVTTIVLVVGLTLFAFQTKIDFTIMSGVLFVCLLGLIMFGIMAAIFNSEVLKTLYAALGAILFSCYIVVDTQLMMGGKHKLAVSPEEYVFAALNLYLDIVNLFLMLLTLFGGGD